MNKNANDHQSMRRAGVEPCGRPWRGDHRPEKRTAALRPAARADRAAGRRASRGLARAMAWNRKKLKGNLGRAPTAALRQPPMFFRAM
ncbi:MAG TPA: hypothetical protein VMT49_06055, partial [Steroidobacteraceae bacterium]|nr:hypothetical protein [Steroidobacteraceae bacterium]